MSAPKRILLVDDNPEDRESVRRYLKQDRTCEYSFVEAQTVEAGLRAVIEQEPDCVVLDYSLTDGTGLRFLKRLRETDRGVLYPVVMLTGTGDEMIAVQAMKNGAQDYLIKGKTSAESLRLAVRNAMYKAETMQLLARQRDELQRLYRDAQETNVRKDDLLRELQRARDLAEAANQAKDRFLATLSHELRTPLTPVLSTVSAMLQEGEPMPAEVRSTFAMIRRNIGLEARLIDDLLDLTRITRGKLTLDLRPADLHACVREAIEICRPDLAGRKIELREDLHAGRSAVLADPARLQQVIWNLLKNAIKFTLGEGVVTVTSWQEEEEIFVRIADTGIGIEAAHLPSVFNAFEQGSAEQARRMGGLGLGLTISKALAEAHHGALTVESAGPGQGAAFTLRLQLADAAEAPAPSEPPRAEQRASGRAGSILLVEDHSDSAAALSRALRRRGFTVTHAASVQEGAEVYAGGGFDLLVCDIGLPDGTGLDLLKRLREAGPVRAIALSGYGMDHDLRRSHEAGFAAHLTKPVEFQTLALVIDEVLSAPA